MSEEITKALGLAPEEETYLREVSQANSMSEAEILQGTISILRRMANRGAGRVIDAWIPYDEDNLTFRLPFDPSAHRR